MIDIEPIIYTKIRTALLTEHPTLNISGTYERNPATLPHVCFECTSNVVWRNSRTNVVEENAAAVFFECNVYSDKKSGKKAECKELMNIVDETMANMGFTRNFLQPTPNEFDSTVFRLTGRWQGIVDTKFQIIRR